MRCDVPLFASCAALEAAPSHDGRGMLFRWTLAELLRVCGVDRPDLRLEAADEDVQAGGGWAEGHHDLATSTSSPPSEVNEPSQNVFAVSALPMTYANMLQMCAEIPEPHYKCCGERCLHKLECENPGWIENKTTELQDILKLRRRERSTRMLLRVTRRGRVQKGKRGKQQHPAYSSAFDEVEELLTSRGA